MSTQNKEKIISKMIRDLSFLKLALEKKFKRKIDAKSFDIIISDLKQKGTLNYKSQLLSIEFEKENIPKYFSKERIENLKVFFSVKVEGDIDSLVGEKDPFISLEFNIFARGKTKSNRLVMYSLHFDRHIDEGNESEEVHPMYHFQFGGRKIEDEDIDRGDVLFLDAPRIMYHPMEFILGIDFLLSNFLPNEWKEISRKNQNYKNIIKDYQEYFVLPYYKSIVNHFDRKVTNVWDSKLLYPQLIERI